MNKETLDKITMLTRECLVKFWQKDCEIFLKYMSSDVIWIGAQKNQFIRGYDEAAKNIKSIVREMKKCSLTCQEFFAASNSGKCCTIAGRYIATIESENDAPLKAQQRVTFVWELTKDENIIKPEMKLIHISNPIGELSVDSDENFVNKIGEMAYRYLNDKIEYIKNEKQISVYDTDNNLRLISVFEIEYAESNKRSVLIYTTKGVIDAKIKWADFIKATDTSLIKVHRNYAVNPAYVMYINKNTLIMKSGAGIPIPKKKTKDVYDNIMKYNGM